MHENNGLGYQNSCAIPCARPSECLRHVMHPAIPPTHKPTCTIYRNTRQHPAIHCNTLQHAATHCTAHAPSTATHCNTLQHTATHCNILQHTATQYNALQHIATRCNTVQHTASHTYLQLLAVVHGHFEGGEEHGKDIGIPRASFACLKAVILPHLQPVLLCMQNKICLHYLHLSPTRTHSKP